MKYFQHILLCLMLSSIFLVTTLSAETIVCSGDSVVIVISGHKQGLTLWQQSSDKTTWLPAQGTSYNDSLIIIATTSLYYSAIVKDGTCSPIYSDTVLVTVHPVASIPNANSASNVTINSFVANWTASAGATAYYLDVATNAGFTAFVSGNKNINVGNVTAYTDTGLTGSTTYYYRVRANNSCGSSSNSNTILVVTATSDYCTVTSKCSGNITDTRDNKIYRTVQIGNQCWMAQNLNAGNRIDGNTPQTPGADNQNADVQKYCYGDDPNNCIKYGGLYLWGEMMAYGLSKPDAPGPQGICPAGWHIPTDSECTCLEKTLDAGTKAGGKLKDTSTLWTNNVGANNNSGFSALPGGYHNIAGLFAAIGSYTGWWTSVETAVILYPNGAWYHSVSSANAQAGASYGDKSYSGFSVRCVKD